MTSSSRVDDFGGVAPKRTHPSRWASVTSTSTVYGLGLTTVTCATTRGPRESRVPAIPTNTTTSPSASQPSHRGNEALDELILIAVALGMARLLFTMTPTGAGDRRRRQLSECRGGAEGRAAVRRIVRGSGAANDGAGSSGDRPRSRASPR